MGKNLSSLDVTEDVMIVYVDWVVNRCVTSVAATLLSVRADLAYSGSQELVAV